MKTKPETLKTDPKPTARLEIKLNGETPDQLWGSLLGLITYAVECKQKQDGYWPHMVSTNDGNISVRQSDALTSPTARHLAAAEEIQRETKWYGPHSLTMHAIRHLAAIIAKHDDGANERVISELRKEADRCERFGIGGHTFLREQADALSAAESLPSLERTDDCMKVLISDERHDALLASEKLSRELAEALRGMLYYRDEGEGEEWAASMSNAKSMLEKFDAKEAR